MFILSFYPNLELDFDDRLFDLDILSAGRSGTKLFICLVAVWSFEIGSQWPLLVVFRTLFGGFISIWFLPTKIEWIFSHNVRISNLSAMRSRKGAWVICDHVYIKTGLKTGTNYWNGHFFKSVYLINKINLIKFQVES